MWQAYCSGWWHVYWNYRAYWQTLKVKIVTFATLYHFIFIIYGQENEQLPTQQCLESRWSPSLRTPTPGEKNVPAPSRTLWQSWLRHNTNDQKILGLNVNPAPIGQIFFKLCHLIGKIIERSNLLILMSYNSFVFAQNYWPQITIY